MVNLGQLRDYVVRPALIVLEPWVPHSQASENLVFGTGLTESGYQFIDQTTPGPGPAYGFWQMEEATHRDLWANWIMYQPIGLQEMLLTMAGCKRGIPAIATLHGNLFYAAAMCRIHYRRVKEKLPAENDATGLAGYWKRYYNTAAGAGTIAKALPFFRQAVQT